VAARRILTAVIARARNPRAVILALAGANEAAVDASVIPVDGNQGSTATGMALALKVAEHT